MFAVQTVKITLGEKEFTIREAPHGRAAPWRRRLMEEVKPIFDKVTGVADMQFETPADLLALVPVFELLFLDGINQIFELLIAYSPELEAEREYIENNASERQIFAGFMEVIRLADFFGILPQIRRQVGPALGVSTSPKSQSQNGASAPKKRRT